MKRIFTVLIAVSVLMLCVTAASSPGEKPIPRQAWGKLLGPLKDAAKIYRSQPKIETGQPAAVLRQKGGKFEYRRPFLSQVLIDEKVQKRWHNPPYDVLKCLIKVQGNAADALQKYGVKVRSVSDLGEFKIISVEMGAPALEKIAALPSVLSISPIPKKELTCDLATAYTGAAAIRLKQGDEFDESTKGYSGKGVIVGMVDTGIDVTHEDFRDANGTRILYFWDPLLETPGKTPADLFGGALSGLDYGTVWTKADIDAGLCTSEDDYGHGTHVTGIAVGRGRVSEQYAGMAPNADLIVVKEDYTNNGVLFIYELSKRLGKPCVVSLGYTIFFNLHMVALYPGLFPADGSDAGSLEIKGWNRDYGPGHVPVKTAANYGHWPSYTNSDEFPYRTGAFHADASLTAASTHILAVPDYAAMWAALGWPLDENDYPTVVMGMWYESPLQVSFISPNGNIIGPMIHGTSGTAVGPVPAEGMVKYALDNPQAANGHYHATFELGDFSWTQFCPQPGDWQVVVEPLGSTSGRVDMWCADIEYWLGNAYPLFFGHHPQVSFKNGSHTNYIIDESASPEVICVGGWVTKDQWLGTDGQVHTYPQGFIHGAVLTHSSPGPARNGVVKPDIAAPATVVGPLTNGFFYYDPEIILQGGKYAIFAGNSAAAPVVVGGIALMLEKYPNLSLTQVKDLIKDNALQDNFTAEYGANAFGHGKFSVAFLNERPVAQVSAAKIEGDIVFDASASYDPEGFPLTYDFKVETQALADGDKPKDFSFTSDGAVLTLVPDPLISGYYRVKLAVNDSITNSKKVYSDWLLIQY